MWQSPKVALPENLADDGMKMNILVPSGCCGPNTDTKPLKWPSGNITPMDLDCDVLALVEMVFLAQLRKRVGQGPHALTAVVFYVRMSQ